jgi:type I restriction enzyme M protein
MANFILEKQSFGKNISDPCCGSGRLILASNNFTPGNYFVAQDLDHICVKMACINLAMHGIKAEVHHMNTLGQEKPYNSYIINHDYWKTKSPSVFKIDKK